MAENRDNRDERTIDAFGDEWSAHTQENLSSAELESLFDKYFQLFPWSVLPANAIGFDMGCGSGRWAAFVARRVSHLHCIDASGPALQVARRNLETLRNVTYHHATTQSVGLPAESCDFGYSLGVLHHIPDTDSAVRDCVRLLKPGAPFLVYLYYAFDNRSRWYWAVWRLTEELRRLVSSLSPRPKGWVTDFIAIAVYWPLARLSAVLERLGFNVEQIPLSFYRRSSIATLRTDSRDRFGTPLEQRFTRKEISTMLERAGLESLTFSDSPPYWCVVGFKAASKS